MPTQAERERAARARLREEERLRREREREAARQEKERQRLYVVHREAEVAALNSQLGERMRQLAGVLSASLGVDAYVEIEELKQPPEIPALEVGDLATPEDAPRRETPKQPGALARLLPGVKSKYLTAVALAEERYQVEMEQWEQADKRREKKLAELAAEHERQALLARQKTAAEHERLDALKAALGAGEREAIAEYFSIVLTHIPRPDGLPRTHRVAFVPQSRQLVVEIDLPTFDVIPEVREYRYVKSRDEIAHSARPASQRRTAYASLISQLALATLHELFQADRDRHFDTVALNAHVDSIDRRTGRPARPCLITVRTTHEVFEGLDLARVEPAECLRGLNAGVSRNPAELAPVRPVLEFNMADPRFVQEADVISDIDGRPNLMDLTPSEFESLITNLFETMGLQTRLTRPSRDGGVDCVAYDPRPIVGGKVVIQAKRYKNTVGVSAVRDLFGTLQSEGASKGILVTTSGYGKASFEFAQNKPVELLDGSNLLYLLEQHAGVSAKIEPPEDWIDPRPDTETAER